ncbi:MAG: hypothetical protein A2W31_14425 [Planctomycetes bacterium RBG_16_64_10]|nr:MAG: hypothetical protein A2W31_14425 [Planctomycetes bacterium RBG_16_64_10]
MRPLAEPQSTGKLALHRIADRQQAGCIRVRRQPVAFARRGRGAADAALFEIGQRAAPKPITVAMHSPQ